MVRKGAVEGVDLDSSPVPTFCEACVRGKAHRKVFPKISNTTYSRYGEKVVTNLWGPAQVQSFIRPHVQRPLLPRTTRCILKGEIRSIYSYKGYEAWVKVHHNSEGIACLGSDRGGEFLDGEFKTYLQKVGTVRHLNIHNSPLVLEGPVSGLEKDRNWTGLDRKKDRTAVLVFHI